VAVPRRLGFWQNRIEDASEGSYTLPGSPRRAGLREEARDATRRGRTPSPARCGRKVRDDLRDPPGSETQEEEAERAGFGPKVGCGVGCAAVLGS
jgi:hypothetical protein